MFFSFLIWLIEDQNIWHWASCLSNSGLWLFFVVVVIVHCMYHLNWSLQYPWQKYLYFEGDRSGLGTKELAQCDLDSKWQNQVIFSTYSYCIFHIFRSTHLHLHLVLVLVFQVSSKYISYSVLTKLYLNKRRTQKRF